MMTRTWWENEAILSQFRDWLTQTADELEALDDNPQQGLWAECEHAGEPARGDADPRDEPALDLPEVGLLAVVEALTATRHELKLQTKGTRSLEAAVEKSLAGLDAASRAFQSVQANEQEAAERAVLPMVEVLIGLDEGLLRATKAFQATHKQMTRTAPQRLRDELDSQFEQQSWWRRLMTRGWHLRVRQSACAALARSTDEEFASLMQGFMLIQSRLARTLEQQSIRRLDETGGQVDPNRMTVVELVEDPVAEPETVIDIVRPGYRWRDRVLRFAEVRAVASRTPRPDSSSQWDDPTHLPGPASPQISEDPAGSAD